MYTEISNALWQGRATSPGFGVIDVFVRIHAKIIDLRECNIDVKKTSADSLEKWQKYRDQSKAAELVLTGSSGLVHSSVL